MDLNFSYFRNDGYVFLVPGLVKRSKPHKPHLEIFLPSFPPDASLCVASYLKRYIETQTEHKQVDSSRLAAVRQCFSKYQVSERASKIIFASWRSGTESQYKSFLGKWHGWRIEREINPVSCNLNFVLEFLTELYYHNYQYRTINVYRSIISASHLPIDGSPTGSHLLISPFMKGIFELRPPQPRSLLLGV